MEKKKEYQISSSVNNGILEVVITGNAIGKIYDKMRNEVDTIIEAYNAKKAIIDVRALEGRIDTAEIYRYVRNNSSVIYEIQAAIVDIPKNAHYKIAAKNAGLSCKWFTDTDAARDWFKSKQRKVNTVNL